MSALHRLFTRVLHFAIRRRADDRLTEEIEAHITAQTEDNIRAGMSPAEARRAARLKFGSVASIRDDYHVEHGLPFLENLLFDLRYALRVLRKSPSFTLIASLTLALGIGANIVVFGVLNAVVLKPLEVRAPQSLFQLRHKPWATGRLLTTSYPAFDDYRRRNTTFSGMAAINAYSSATLRWRNRSIQISGDQVTGNYFDLLGVQPHLARFFHESDEHGPNSAPYLVLSDAFWRRAFGADPAIVGAVVELDRYPFTVVGVAPPQFHGTERFVWPDYWVPMMNEAQLSGGSDYLHDRTNTAVTVIGRLKPRVTPAQATENLNAISAELAKEYPATDDGLPFRLIHPGLFGDEGEAIRGFLYSITALVLLVLAAACANLASLFAARATDRRRELAVRVALGSSRRRLVQQLLTEAVILSALGGAAGLLAAYLLLGALDRWRPSFGGHLAVTVDAPVYLAGLAFTLASALLFGVVPARHAWQSSPLHAMKNGPLESKHVRRFALRDLLLGLQIAICTLLVTASFVAARGMLRTLHTPLGFQPQGALLADIDLDRSGQSTDVLLEKRKQMIDAALRLPGITAAGAVSRTPMTGGLHGVPVYSPGATEFTLKNYLLATYVFSMSPGYFDAAGIRLDAGRDFSWQESPKTPYVAIVNQTFAHRMWGDTRPIGQRFILGGHLTQVVGLAADGKYHDFTESPQSAVYVPMSQSGDYDAILVVRSRLAPKEAAAALQRTFSSIEPNAPITLQSWTDSLQSELFPARAATLALGVMGLLAAMLSVTGIAGMAAYTVSRRMKELGIRAALGARNTQIVTAAVGRPVLLLAVGSALGLCLGILASRLLQHIVYQANPRDPLVLVGTLLTMALLGAVAAAIPARRALALDAAKLMRED